MVTLIYICLLTVVSAQWVAPQGLPAGHNGGTLERLTSPAAGTQPHIVMILLDA